MISFSSDFTAAGSRFSLMKCQRKSVLQLSTVIPPAIMYNWIILLNFVNH